MCNRKYVSWIKIILLIIIEDIYKIIYLNYDILLSLK